MKAASFHRPKELTELMGAFGRDSPLILVIDVGLSHVKTVVFGPAGEIVDRERVPYPTRRVGTTRFEQDPEDWWGAARAGLRAIWARDLVQRRALAGVTVTGHMHALLPLGAEDAVIGPAIVLGDRRAVAEAAAIAEELGADVVYSTIGTDMDASMPAAKARWLAEHAPAVLRQARALLGCKDWLRHRLTGDLLTEPIDACATSLYDLRSRTWSESLLRAARVKAEQLPAIAEPSAVAGRVRPRAAADLGLPSGLPVVTGAGDDVEVLGSGLLEPRNLLEHLGTTGSILAVSDHFLLDPERRLETYPHVVTGLWVIGGSMTAAGSTIGWTAELLGHPDPYASLDAVRIDHVPPFLPHLAGERSPKRSPLARGGWLGLGPEIDRDELMASVLLGVAFGLAAILEPIEELLGPQRRIVVGGGYDVHPAWLRLRASVYGRPLGVLGTTEPTALGAAIVAAVGLGLQPDMRTAVEAMTGVVDEVGPDPRLDEALRRARRDWRAARDALDPVWPEIATIRDPGGRRRASGRDD